jgi:hypothetical protein
MLLPSLEQHTLSLRLTAIHKAVKVLFEPPRLPPSEFLFHVEPVYRRE